MTWSPRHDRPSRRVRVAAWLGVGSLLPYAALKTYWALGGQAGVPPGFNMADEFQRNGAPSFLVWMERHHIDFTAVLALMGVVVLLVLVHPLSLRLPRRLLIVPAWVATCFFLPYGVLTGVVFLVNGQGTGAPQLTPWVVVAGVVAFAGVGAALGVCTMSYQRRSAVRATGRPG